MKDNRKNCSLCTVTRWMGGWVYAIFIVLRKVGSCLLRFKRNEESLYSRALFPE